MLYDPAQHRDDSFLYALNPGVAMPCFAAWSLWCLGLPAQAVDRIEEAIALARELQEPQGLAHAFFFASVLYHLRRDLRMSQQCAEAVINITLEHGLVLYQAMATIMQGSSLSEEGRESEGIDRLREGLAGLDTTGTRLVRPHFLGLLATALSKVEQNDEALRLLDEAITMVNSNDERYFEAELYRLKGELLFKQSPDNRANAEQCFKHSLDIAESQKAKSWQLRTAMSLARLNRDQNKLREIYESFTEGFDTEDLREAKAAL